MDERGRPRERFEADGRDLRAVVLRLLGRRAEAEDAFQGAWLRLTHADAEGLENRGAWLAAVVCRICLDMLRSSAARKPWRGPNPKPSWPIPWVWPWLWCWTGWRRRSGRPPSSTTSSPCPSRRSRRSSTARGRDQAGGAEANPGRTPGGHRGLPRRGPRRSDRRSFFAARARDARPVVLNGMAQAAWVVGWQPRVAFRFTIRGNRIAALERVADPQRLAAMDVVVAGA